MKIYTRTGDNGTTGLFGGKRASKSSPRMHAYGTIDELNSVLGMITSLGALPAPVDAHIREIQAALFSVGTDLATPSDSSAKILRTDVKSAARLEEWIDGLEMSLPPLTQFIIPGGSTIGAELHRARTVCRRAERWIVELAEAETVTPAVIVYVNRLSDYLFVAARYVNAAIGSPEHTVDIPRSA